MTNASKFVATTNKDTTVQVARVGLALGSSILLAKTGISYLQAIDDQTRESSPPK